MRLRIKEKWNAYLQGVLEGKVLRQAAQESEINLKQLFAGVIFFAITGTIILKFLALKEVQRWNTFK